MKRETREGGSEAFFAWSPPYKIVDPPLDGADRSSTRSRCSIHVLKVCVFLLLATTAAVAAPGNFALPFLPSINAVYGFLREVANVQTGS